MQLGQGLIRGSLRVFQAVGLVTNKDITATRATRREALGVASEGFIGNDQD